MRLYRVESDTKFTEYAPEVFANGHLEETLQTWLENNPDAIVEDGRLMLIGREVTTNLGKSIDLLALDREGDAVVIELKKDETPRTTLAQALEYTAFAADLGHEDLEAVYRTYLRDPERSFSEDHRTYFDLGDEEAVSFNKDQRVVIVGHSISPQIRATSSYLRRRELRVTCVEFNYFTTASGEQLLSTEIVVGLEPVTTQVTSSAAGNSMSEEKFLDLAGDQRPVFEALLAMAKEHDLHVSWGTKGFSVSAKLEGKRVVLFFGWPPATNHPTLFSLATDFTSLAQKVEGGAELVAQTATALSSSGLWKPGGQSLKLILARPLTSPEIEETKTQMLKLNAEIHRRGIVSKVDADEAAG